MPMMFGRILLGVALFPFAALACVGVVQLPVAYFHFYKSMFVIAKDKLERTTKE